MSESPSKKQLRRKMVPSDHPLFGPFSGCGRMRFPDELLREILAMSDTEETEEADQITENESESEGKSDDNEKTETLEREEIDVAIEEDTDDNVDLKEKNTSLSPKGKKVSPLVSPSKSPLRKSLRTRSQTPKAQASVLSKSKPRSRQRTKNNVVGSSKRKAQSPARGKSPKKKAMAVSNTESITNTNRKQSVNQGTWGLVFSGEFANSNKFCSGHFEKVRDEKVNNKPVWRYKENVHMCLWYTKKGSWIVGRADSKGAGLERGFVVSEGPAGPNPTCVTTWKVWSGKHWQINESVKLTGYKFRAWNRYITKMQASVQENARRKSTAICVYGAKEQLAVLINGYYVLQSTLYNMRPLYQKFPGEDIWLRFGPDGDWTISTGPDKEANNSNCLCYSQGRHALPSDSTVWKVDRGDKTSVTQSLEITPYSPTAWASKQAKVKVLIARRTREAMKRAAKQAKGICISGVKGPKAADVNGYYELASDDPFNGRPLYQKIDAPDIWLRMAKDGDWGITYTESKDVNDCDAIFYCSGKPRLLPATAMLLPCEEESEWMGLGDDLDFKHQPSVSVVGLTPKAWAAERARQDQLVLAEATEKAVTIRMMGAEGVNATAINGYYRLQSDVFNGRPLYQKVHGKDTWLWRASDGDWTIGSTASMVSNSLDSICYSVGLPGFNPSEAREWKVDNGKEWVESSVRAVAYPVFRALRL